MHKKTMKKRFLPIIAGAILALCVGCGQSKPATDSAKEASSTTAQANNQTVFKIGAIPDYDQSLMEESLNDFATYLSGKTGLKVEYVPTVVEKLKTDDSHEDSIDYPQERACARGRAQRQIIYGVDRLKYPMKRVRWSPEAPNGEYRGKDEWERISWDERNQFPNRKGKRGLRKSICKERVN